MLCVDRNTSNEKSPYDIIEVRSALQINIQCSFTLAVTHDHVRLVTMLNGVDNRDIADRLFTFQ